VSNAQLWIGLLLAVAVTFFTTATVAMHHLSRVHLSERLQKKGKGKLLDRLTASRDELIFCCSLLRICAILGLVFLIAQFYGIKPRSVSVGQYVAVFVSGVLLLGLIGVTLPNAWARYGGSGFLSVTLPALLAMRYILYPAVAVHRVTDLLVRRLAGVPQADDKQVEADQIEQEILEAISEGELAGAVHEEDAEMIESVMEFRDKDVAEIMTPRTEIAALPSTATLADAKAMITREGHSRIPIYDENVDDIKGVLYAKDLLSLDEGSPFRPAEVMRKVPFVPETKRIPDLLAELREKQVHLAIVVDEYGGTAGLVTIEDIIEEIVGEIADEYEAPEPEPIRRIGPHALEVDARVHINELNEELEIEIPEDKDYDTVGGFLFSEMGKIPEAGEQMRYENVRFSVLDAEERKINRLRIEVLADEGVA